MKRRWIKLGLALVTSAFVWMGGVPSFEMPILGSGEANAVIGMPLTPLSYAGVARRTVRRGYYW